MGNGKLEGGGGEFFSSFIFILKGNYIVDLLPWLLNTNQPKEFLSWFPFQVEEGGAGRGGEGLRRRDGEVNLMVLVGVWGGVRY